MKPMTHHPRRWRAARQATLLLFFLFTVLTGWAQVTGTVLDETGEPLPGATVLLVGTGTGTTTDFDGNFTIQASPEDQLAISFIGYEEQVVTVGSQSSLTILLEPDTDVLEEVVVVGYGTMKKSDVVGSVSSISGDALADMRMSSFDQGLQGAVAGVQVNQAGGVPGGPLKIQVRGTNSLVGGTTPLIVVDGVPVAASPGRTESFNPMAFINPNDIESVTVLKDASATAIYGSRGANGVILITTKSGKAGKTTVNVSYTVGVSQAFNLMELADTDQWFDMADQALEESGLSPIEDTDLVVGAGSLLWPFTAASYNLTRGELEDSLYTTNWYDQALRTGWFQEANISASGGTDKASYFLSTGYRQEESVYVGSKWRRVVARGNIDSELLPFLKTGIRLNFTGIFDREPLVSEGFRSAATTNLPWLPQIDPRTGLYNDPRGGYNMHYTLDYDYQHQRREEFRNFTTTYLQLDVPGVEGLSFRTEVGFDLRFYIRNSYESFFIARQEGASDASQSTIQNMSLNHNYYLKFDRTIAKDHSVVAAGGIEFNHFRTRWSTVTGTGPTQRKDINEPGTVSTDNFKQDLAGTVSDPRFVGIFGRLTYTFRDRYVINGSMRRDASSKFPADNRWGTFPAISGGYIISEEPFWFGGKAFNYMRLKASYGKTGNDQVPVGLGADQYVDWPRYLDFPGRSLVGVGVPSLGWENIFTAEAGFDFGFFNNRISGGVTYFNMTTQDMLFRVQVPGSYGISPYARSAPRQWTNFADMTNRGLELELQGIVVDAGDWRYDVSFNLSVVGNEVTRLTLSESTGSEEYTGQAAISNYVVLRTGDPMGLYALASYAGVDDTGRELIHEVDAEGNLTGQTLVATTANVRENRMVDPDIHTQPTYWGGITQNVSWKNLSLSVFAMFQGGNHILDLWEQEVSYVNGGDNQILASVANDRWESSFSNTDNPRPLWSGLPILTDRFLHRGDFLKLRNVRLAYTLPTKWTGRAQMSSAQVFVMATNLLTLTSFPGFDPELIRQPGGNSDEALFTNNLGQSVVAVNSIFPQVRTYSFGFNLGF